jgi:hypothetical protein
VDGVDDVVDAFGHGNTYEFMSMLFVCVGIAVED